MTNTHFEKYVKYEGPIPERKELFDEEPQNIFSSLKRNKGPRYDDISSNLIKSVSNKIFGLLIHVVNLSIHQGVFSKNMKIPCFTQMFKYCDEYLFAYYRPCLSLSIAMFFKNPGVYHEEQSL